MITPSHIIYGWAAARGLDGWLGESRTRVMGAIMGGFIPDLPAYLFFLYYDVVVGASQTEMWDVLYFDSQFSPFINLSHSFLLWPFVLALSYALGRQFLFWLSASALLHSVIDFCVHHDDAYKHFWPLTDWRFESPLSYWDTNHYGAVVGSVDTVIVLLLLVYLFTKVTSTKRRFLLIAIACLYLLMTILPHIIFASN